MSVIPENSRFKPYELGHDEIDRQHYEIYESLVKIRDTVPPDGMPHLLVNAIRSVINHFKYEEQLMEEVDYAYIDNHKAVHAKVCWLFAELIVFATKEGIEELIKEHLRHIEYHDRLVVTWWKVHQHRRSTDQIPNDCMPASSKSLDHV